MARAMERDPNLAGPSALREAATQLGRRWSALQDAASAVGLMAGLAPEKPDSRVRNLPTLVRNAEPWRRELAMNRVADISAMLEPGLAALLAVYARGQDATAPALTLWREYHAARTALLALLPDGASALGPRRSA